MNFAYFAPKKSCLHQLLLARATGTCLKGSFKKRDRAATGRMIMQEWADLLLWLGTFGMCQGRNSSYSEQAELFHVGTAIR